jgi:hypothetical protein
MKKKVFVFTFFFIAITAQENKNETIQAGHKSPPSIQGEQIFFKIGGNNISNNSGVHNVSKQ